MLATKKDIMKHNEEISRGNSGKFKKIQPYVPHVSGYLAGGSKYKYIYKTYKAAYLAVKSK